MESVLPAEEWIDQIRAAIADKVYTDDEIRDCHNLLSR
jgi:hypothetical protein